ncbi:MAG: PAS domain-containing protein [Rhodospirillaceae bacterium]|nr:PAS domain-containing protein [Rhodospirillaceae bacterium]
MRTFEQLTVGTSLHPKILRMHEYWLAKRADRLMPARSDIDPLELRDCLGNLCIVEVTGDSPPRFRFRLDGSSLVLSTGFDMTGKFLEEMPDVEYQRFVAAIYRRVVETRAPVFVVNQEDWKGYDLQVESVTMPLSGDGVRVDGILDAIFTAVQR